VPPEAEELSGMPLPRAGESVRAWFDVAGLDGLAPDVLAAADVGGVPLIVGNVEGTLLAYRNRCASCGGPLHGGEFSGGALTCPACGRSFFLPRAGRSLDDDALQLDPIPLLRENGSVKVALAQ
jgi:nitrite reductase/ring-hydroxylating ferredoxin subunit